jgi:hypothetical protein
MLVACGGSVEAEPAQLTVAIESPSFTWCRCHHGFGPGLDGTATVKIQSTGKSSATFTAVSLRLLPAGTGPTYSSADSGGWVKIDRTSNIAVAGGALATPKLTSYLDTLVTDPPATTSYRVELTYSVDGASRVVTSAPFDVAIAPP